MAKRTRCLAAQGAFRKALHALEVLPQQLVTLMWAYEEPVQGHDVMNFCIAGRTCSRT